MKEISSIYLLPQTNAVVCGCGPRERVLEERLEHNEIRRSVQDCSISFYENHSILALVEHTRG
jgi:hypothetical protein